MNNIFNFSIVSSFLGLWISTHVPESFELILGFILIFTFGMIHGSNDLLIVKKLLKNIKHYSKFTLLIAYLFIVSLAILVFYLIPSLAMILFVLFSAYHFGEQHWEENLMSIQNIQLIQDPLYCPMGYIYHHHHIVLNMPFPFSYGGILP